MDGRYFFTLKFEFFLGLSSGYLRDIFGIKNKKIKIICIYHFFCVPLHVF